MFLSRRSFLFASLGGLLAVVGATFGSCGGANGTSRPVLPTFGPVSPLTATEVNLILDRAVASLATNDLHVAVVDRTGLLLGAYSTAGPTIQDEDNIALSLARTTAFFSNSQAPLSSRTVETLSTFHFPPTFANELIPSPLPESTGVGLFPNSVIAPQRRTTGIVGTPQGPLWQINSTNRGAAIESGFTTPPTAFILRPEFNFAQFFPSRNIDGSFPSPGITLLPGAVPLYKSGRLVGGVGCYVRRAGVTPPVAGTVAGDPDVAAAEFAAISGASGSGVPGDENFFLAIPPEGAITIVGILLPYVKQTTRPAGYAQGVFPGLPGIDPNFLVLPGNGQIDPFGYLIGPRPAQTGSESGNFLTQNDVERIIDQVVASANITRAQVRLPLGSAAKVIATIVDRRGLILAHFRMEDTLCDAVDVVPAKARSTVYFCQPGGPAAADRGTDPALFSLFDVSLHPRGLAFTTRTLGFLSQPFFPPGIDENSGTPGPLLQLALANRLPGQVDRWGTEIPDDGYQNGLTFFPGSVPLYKNGELVGALGVSGDGVEQNDLIAFDGGRGFEPPPELQIENFTYLGVRLPYLKFPQTPR